MRAFPIVLLASLFLAGCTAPAADVSTAGVNNGQGGTGGHVQNAPPVVSAFAADRTMGDNGGAFTVVFSGSVTDDNTERQVRSIRVHSTPAGMDATHLVSPEEANATSEPGGFGPDGFKVWTATKGDGVLMFRYRHTFPAAAAAGAYAIVATGTDQAEAFALSNPVILTLSKFSLVTVAPSPVDAQGRALTGAAWGGWQGVPGARNVAAVNYLKLVNDGDKGDASVIVDFSEAAFRGVEDADFSVPIDGNIQFAWWEDKTPQSSSPAEGTFAFKPASAEGATTVQFTGKGNVIYVTYRLVELPRPLPAQAYGGSFTVTELA